MTKKFTKIMAFIMATLMVITILPAEYLIGNAFNVADNTLSFVDAGDSEVKINGNVATIEAKTYQKEYELKYQFRYKIDYTTKSTYAPGQMVYVLPSLGFYDNGVTSGYIMPKNIEVNNNGSDIWQYEEATVGNSKVIRITNKVELNSTVVTDGFMQFATTINPRTQMAGSTLNAIQVLASEDGGTTWNNNINSLTWNCNLYADVFHINGEIKDVEVESASELGADADDFYWAKYQLHVTSEDADWHSLEATDFKFNFIPTTGATIYSINGDKNPTMDGNKAVVSFNAKDWNYTANVGSKDFTIIMKYPKATFDGSEVQNVCSLDIKLLGSNDFEAASDCTLKNSLHDYTVKYDGDLFSVSTDRNPGFEISWNSLKRNQASPFSFYMSAISRYNTGEYNTLIENDHLEILQNDGTFRRLKNTEYAINRVVLNDLSHFKNSLGEQYTSLDFSIVDQDVNPIKSGSIGNAPQTITLPANTTYIGILFYGMEQSLYLDSTAIQTVGVIKVENPDSVMKEGELRNLVTLLVMDDDGNVLNPVDASSYDGADGTRLAQADMDEYGYYVQRDIATQVVTAKASQINVATRFNPAKSVYNNTSKKQDSAMEIEAFFAAPGEVSSFSLYSVLPDGVNASTDVSFSAESSLHLADGSEITVANAPDFLKNHADIEKKENYKGTGRDYIAVNFSFEKGKEVCYDSTMTNDFTSGKITASIPVEVEDKDASYTAVAGMIFNDEHHETIIVTKDNGAAPLVAKDSVVWTDINDNGDVEEIVDYATATLTSVRVQAGDVAGTPSVKIEKTADKTTYNKKETIVYTIKVTNDGEAVLHNVVVTDSLTGTFDAHAKATINGNKATIAELAVGESVSLTYRVAVPGNSKDGDKVRNVADVTTDEKVTDEDEVTVTIEVPTVPPVDAPSIHIEKIADKATYNLGETILYTISVLNNGNVDLHNVVVTDSITGGEFEVTDDISVDGNKVTIATLPVGETVTFVYRIDVPTASKNGDKLRNVVNVTTDEKVTDEDEVTVTIVVPDKPPVDAPSVKVEKTANKTTYNLKETIVYTIKVSNNGNTALHNVVVTDSMTGTFDANAKATINGNKATIAELAVGETVNLTYRVTVPENSKNNDKLRNVVNVTTDEKVTDEDEVTVTVVIPDTPPVDTPSVKVEKTADKEVYKVKDTVTYTIKVTNTGSKKLTNVTITESMDGTYDVATSNPLTVNGRVVNLGTLAPNESKTVFFKYVVPANAKNNDVIKNTVTVTTDENATDKDEVDVKVEVPNVVVEKPSIDITKTADKEQYNSGETIIYTIKVKNNGNIDLKDVKVIETLSGTWKELSKNVEAKDSMNALIKELKAGASETLKFEFKVSDTAKDYSSIKNIVKATEETHKLSDEDDVTVKIVQKENPKLEIKKTADRKSVKPGETIKFTIVVKNTGNVTLKNVNVVDSLTNGKFETLDGATKANDYTLIIPELKIGESKTFTFSYKVDEKSTAKEITNTATAIESSHNIRIEDKVSVPLANKTTNPIQNMVQTGDNAPIMVMFGLAMLSLLGMSILAFTNKKRK